MQRGQHKHMQAWLARSGGVEDSAHSSGAQIVRCEVKGAARAGSTLRRELELECFATQANNAAELQLGKSHALALTPPTASHSGALRSSGAQLKVANVHGSGKAERCMYHHDTSASRTLSHQLRAAEYAENHVATFSAIHGQSGKASAASARASDASL
jgi:hypothetical protein